MVSLIRSLPGEYSPLMKMDRQFTRTARRALFSMSCLTSFLILTSPLPNTANGSSSDGGSSTTPTTTNVVNDGPLPPDSYPYHVKMDDNYDLKWNFNSTHILFLAHVKTKGYIGFGISDHGSMYPSDVIIAWVKDGQVHFADRHATGHSMPVVDDHQDWQVISGKEEGEYTTITMIRALETCDDQDFPILAGTTRLIYSYSPTDPDSDSSIPYHGNTRGTKSVLLLDPPAKETNQNTLPDDVTTIDFLNRNFSLPSLDTTYECTVWKLPPLDGKHHVIRYEPVIQEGHEHLIHHIVLYYCTGIPEYPVGTGYDCYWQVAPTHSPGCTHVFLAWGIGGTAFNYPPHVGHSLGTPDDPEYFIMETHYDNVRMQSGVVDSSGLRLYLTQQLRPHDAGMLEVGVIISDHQIIPPFYETFISRGYCHADCLAEVIDDDGIYIFSDFLHSHLAGKSIVTRHLRGDVELPPILEDRHYDFDYQEQRMLSEERHVKKGDTLFTDCYYDTRDRKTITYGGLGSRQEMCISFILYYPRIPMTYCVSVVEYNLPAQNSSSDVFDFVKSKDWANKTVRDEFVQIVEDSDTFNICHSSVPNKYDLTVTPQPNITEPYIPVDHCKTEP